MECPDCKKMITPKSFKYSHTKTCGAITKYNPSKTSEPVIESQSSKPKEKAKKKEPPPEVTPEPQPEIVAIKP